GLRRTVGHRQRPGQLGQAPALCLNSPADLCRVHLTTPLTRSTPLGTAAFPGGDIRHLACGGLQPTARAYSAATAGTLESMANARTPLTLMAVHAHPDDEAISTGGVLARAAAEGI